MGSQTSLVARQYRLREWAEQIQECKNRPAEVTVAQWCDQHDITTSNFYYRQREVRKALLTTVQDPSLEQECQEIPFVDISGYGSVWLERSLWEREVQSSNLCTPTAEWRGLGNTLSS